VVDGHALAFIDVQAEPAYIHNPVVQEGSRVTVMPFGYGAKVVEGTPSEETVCTPA
jgi:hypothetical protein